MKAVLRTIYKTIQMLDLWSAQLACQTMKWRRFSGTAIHPKHLFDEQRIHFLSRVLKPGMNFLDLGSGVGSDCIYAKQNGAEIVVGIEKDQKSIETAMARSKKAGVEVAFISHDIELAKLPVQDRFFDIVYFSDVLEHLNNRVTVLKDLKRKKKADGLVIFSVPNADTSWKKKLRSVGLDSHDDADHKIEYSKDSLKAELESAGLEIVSKLHPIIPSLPINGLFALSAAISPHLYQRLQAAKRRFVKKNPIESIGWIFLAR